MMCPVCDAFIDDEDVWCPECDSFLDEEFFYDDNEEAQLSDEEYDGR